MAVLQLFSDIHLEFLSPSKRVKYLKSLNADGVDVAVLAGDICLEPMLEMVLAAFCAVYPEVVFIPGNHEYYKSTPKKVTSTLTRLDRELSNLTWLDCRRVKVGDLWFVGGTLWFPMPTDPAVRASAANMNDFHIIKDFQPWVYEENMRCQAMLNAFLKPSNSSMPGADVVVTHHMPAHACVSPRYRGSVLNHFFTCDQTDLIKESGVPLWVFGHTHDRMVKRIGDTMVVCNAQGYPHEPESKERGVFLERCLINVKSANGQVTFPNGEPG
jgi:predicted phosphodiesterase